jgi:4,5-dihydroxyphthalate decarboxylase
MNLPLSLAIAPYEHARDLRPRGIDLVTLELSVEEIFYRFTRFREWDASEMSFAKVTALVSEDKPDIVALPVFPSRVFRHSAIYAGDGVKKPKDLEGRRVGIPEWAQTAGIYVRGMLAEEYGVDLSKIDWHQAGVHQPGRVEKIELKLPKGIRITRHADKTLAGMLAAGELDAVISARSVPCPRLFEDSQRLELEYFKKTRIFPIMHVVVLRRQVYERDRWVAMNLFTAFEESKRASMKRLADIGASQVPLPWIPEQVRAWQAIAGDDYWPYGVEPSRPTLEAFFRWSYEQGVARRLLKMEDVFAPETREQFKI